ncbi:MAG: hypothetical protein AABW80_05235 [Nanoarchaeota archaeon]
MEAKDVKVDLRDMKEFKRRNFEDRLKFIDFWVDYIKKNADKVWTKNQADFIDAQHQIADRFQKIIKRK